MVPGQAPMGLLLKTLQGEFEQVALTFGRMLRQLAINTPAISAFPLLVGNYISSARDLLLPSKAACPCSSKSRR